MIRRPPRSTQGVSSAASDVYKRQALPVPARNEVRAVYGGYGVAMAVLLVVCRDQPQWRDGVVVTLSLALLGMAVGRLLSWLVDRRLDRYPALFMVIEIVLGVGLLTSL